MTVTAIDNARFVAVDVTDLRFPTSLHLDGSDAMNPEPDYSATYVVLRTDADDGLEGHGFTFTIGRGNEICVAAVHALAPLLVGSSVSCVLDDLGGFWRKITGDSQLRWIGPEKGVIHLATAAVVNAVWDLRAKREAKPLWRVLCDMSPEELASCIDYRYISDEITSAWVVDRLQATRARRPEREQELIKRGLPAYTTSAGWLGYDDDKLRALCREAVADGWTHLKMKVGADRGDDVRRAAILRGEIGDERFLMMDANQVWNVDDAIERTLELASFNPLWMEEPTSPDDILGHARIARAIDPIGVATGEHVHNRIMFKQLLQADAIRYCQVDAARLGGVNEVLSVLFMAAKRGVTVCPHAGGVGLCEYVQHLALFDAVAVAPDVTDRVVEYVDLLHEHFIEPVRIHNAAYVVPEAPGYSADILPESLEQYRFPNGAAWRR
ncbi:enolase C-terminal domain-like protein [Gaiella sp.]|uniref:enolase C-terminal domain-like protein n=2 Tax=Gaiella sp. TaxID=2663207 RepID=UPI0039830358